MAGRVGGDEAPRAADSRRTAPAWEIEERFRHAFQHGATAMALVSASGEFLRVNAAACELMGRPEAELACLGLADVTHPEDLVAESAAIDQLLTAANRKATELFDKTSEQLLGAHHWWETMPVHRDGRPFTETELPSLATLRDGLPREETIEGIDTRQGRRWLSVNTRPIFHAGDESPRAVAISFADITDVIEASELKNRLAAIVESSLDAIISTSIDGQIVTWNAGAERLYGYRADEAIGQNVSMLVPPGRANETATAVGRAA